MSNELRSEELSHFLMLVYREVEKNPLEGLTIWSNRFTDYRNQGRFDLCERLLGFAKSLTLPTHAQGVVLYSEAWLADRMGNWEYAIETHHKSLEYFHKAGIDVINSEIWSNIGSIYQDQGLLREAGEAYEQALTAADDKHDLRAHALVVHNKGGLFLLKKDYNQALGCFEESERIFRESGDKSNEVAATLGIANVKRAQGNWYMAQMKIINVCVQYHDLGDSRGLATAMGSLAILYQERNRWLEAQHQYEQALVLFNSAGDQINAIKTVGNLAVLCDAQGKAEEAVKLFHRAQEGYREAQDRHGEASTLVNLACLYRRLAAQHPQNSEWQAKAVEHEVLARQMVEAYNYQAEMIRLQSASEEP